MRDVMKRLVKERGTCVLATASDNRPHCSLMAYVSDDTGLELYMATKRETRKYRNLSANPWVSLLIDTRREDPNVDRLQTRALTVTGRFESLVGTSKQSAALKRLLERHSHLREFLEGPKVEVFAVKVESFLLLVGLTDAYFETVDSLTEGPTS